MTHSVHIGCSTHMHMARITNWAAPYLRTRCVLCTHTHHKSLRHSVTLALGEVTGTSAVGLDCKILYAYSRSCAHISLFAQHTAKFIYFKKSTHARTPVISTFTHFPSACLSLGIIFALRVPVTFACLCPGYFLYLLHDLLYFFL